MVTHIKNKISAYILRKLTLYLEKPSNVEYHPIAVPNPDALRNILQPCDILLIEGNLKYSEIIKYVTQSTWSHCALYIGHQHAYSDSSDNPPCLVEALLSRGVVISRLSDYFNLNTRILRPVSLTYKDKEKIIDFCLSKVGNCYDIDNVFDLLKYYVPSMRFFMRNKTRSNHIFGSGDPEKVICSSLLAQAFETVDYPVLPSVGKIEQNMTDMHHKKSSAIEILRKRHFSLYSPRDFDTSPFFKIVKPTLEMGFNHRDIQWDKQSD